MSRLSDHVCPIAECSAAVELATAAAAADGAPIWACENDHHGPRIVGYDGVGLV